MVLWPPGAWAEWGMVGAGVRGEVGAQPRLGLLEPSSQPRVQGGYPPVTSWACQTGCCGDGEVGGARTHPLATWGKVPTAQLTRLVQVPLAAALPILSAWGLETGPPSARVTGCPVTHRPELTQSLGTEGRWDVTHCVPQLAETGLWAHPSCRPLPGQAVPGSRPVCAQPPWCPARSWSCGLTRAC